MIPAEAVEAAARAMAPDVWGPRVWQFVAHGESPADARSRVQQESLQVARRAIEAAAPHMLTEAERELFDAQRVIALLVGDAGGKVTISRESITKLPADTVIETTQDVVNGGWVIRVRPTP